MKIRHAWCTDNAGTPLCDKNVKRFISVRPSENQLRFNEMKYYNFIHFGMNTFTDREWGDYDNYDLSLNTASLGIENCADLIAAIAQAEWM